ncbi:uncharacterized protein N7511_009349 [Penicillium nucicola]|uniref:uncharacterized protein n=1 Tax=Penicillium nucicola TaxID=1850975 RepID=UPI0025457D67|nr:uncharacterized protein N7511_009349 [Penicillium nucicola]KAJ5747653.1 hypothetical protein N7511_009349 [Penicillium nucicola]
MSPASSFSFAVVAGTDVTASAEGCDAVGDNEKCCAAFSDRWCRVLGGKDCDQRAKGKVLRCDISQFIRETDKWERLHLSTVLH